jgi:hypothetical protein
MRRMIAASLLLAAGIARADGAFPDSMAIFAPADQPHAIMLATNFGMVISSDDGGTWHLVCESAIASFVSAYQMSAPPDDAIFADTPYGLAVSRDGGCTWTFSPGNFMGHEVSDVFPDPTSAARALAIGRQFSDAGADFQTVTASSDGGRAFSAAPLFTAAPTSTLTGVESARADPTTVYVTLYDDAPFVPRLARSLGGAPFQILDESAAIGDLPRLAAVDPIDPRTIYLRINGADSDRLAISHDAGDTFSVPLTLAGKMSAFLKRTSGTILIGAPDGPSFRSTDGGATFAAWPSAADCSTPRPTISSTAGRSAAPPTRARTGSRSCTSTTSPARSAAAICRPNAPGRGPR